MANAPIHSNTLPPLAEGQGPAPQVGDMLGAYRLDAVAGEGGMGRVFQATHTRLGKRVAVKVLRRRYSHRPEAIARFFQEARAVNVIRHPNIVEITDFVEAPPGGDSYYIMEWLDGVTLAEALRRDRVLPWARVVQIGRQLASALAAVHLAGFVHRDLKPENIFLIEEEGHLAARILDFGVATLSSQLPSEEGPAGTPAYFSPEGAAGRPLDGRSDIYSLGVMLYELLAGAPPFQAASMSEYVMKHMTAKPRPLGEVVVQPLPPLLVHAVERCLDKDPDRRFQSMEELAEVLSILEDEANVPPARPVVEWRPRRLAVMAVVVMLVSMGITRGVRALRSPGPDVDKHQVDEPPRKDKNDAPATGGAHVEATKPAEPARVEVKVISEPAGAEVYLAGVLLGTTPGTIKVPAGVQTLSFVRPGYRATALRVDVQPNATFHASLDADLKSPSQPGPRKTQPAPAQKPPAIAPVAAKPAPVVAKPTPPPPAPKPAPVVAKPAPPPPIAAKPSPKPTPPRKPRPAAPPSKGGTINPFE